MKELPECFPRGRRDDAQVLRISFVIYANLSKRVSLILSLIFYRRIFAQKLLFLLHVNFTLIAQQISRVRNEINSIISFSSAFLSSFPRFYMPICLTHITQKSLFPYKIILSAHKNSFSLFFRNKKLTMEFFYHYTSRHIQLNFIYLKHVRKISTLRKILVYTFGYFYFYWLSCSQRTTFSDIN